MGVGERTLLTQRDLRDYDEPCNMLRPKCFSVVVVQTQHKSYTTPSIPNDGDDNGWGGRICGFAGGVCAVVAHNNNENVEPPHRTDSGMR